MEFPTNEPVGDVYVVLKVLNSGISLEEVAYADVEVGEVFDFLAPRAVTIHVWECYHIAASENLQPFIELALSSCGQPYVVRHQSAADDSRLFGFHKCNGLVREYLQ